MGDETAACSMRIRGHVPENAGESMRSVNASSDIFDARFNTLALRAHKGHQLMFGIDGLNAKEVSFRSAFRAVWALD